MKISGYLLLFGWLALLASGVWIWYWDYYWRDFRLFDFGPPPETDWRPPVVTIVLFGCGFLAWIAGVILLKVASSRARSGEGE